MRCAAVISLALLVATASLHAQDTLVGKYSGSMVSHIGSVDRLVGLSIEITSAENGKLSATATRGSIAPPDKCAGTYQLAGTYEGNALFLRSTSTSVTQDCVLNFKLVAEGNKLKGQGNYKSTVEVSK